MSELNRIESLNNSPKTKKTVVLDEESLQAVKQYSEDMDMDSESNAGRNLIKLGFKRYIELTKN